MMGVLVPHATCEYHCEKAGWPHWLLITAVRLYDADSRIPGGSRPATPEAVRFAIDIAQTISDIPIDIDKAMAAFMKQAAPHLAGDDNSAALAHWTELENTTPADTTSMKPIVATGARRLWPNSPLTDNMLHAIAETAWQSPFPPPDITPAHGRNAVPADPAALRKALLTALTEARAKTRP